MMGPSSLCLHFTVFLIYYWGVQIALADQVNVTIDDTDPMILYTPPESWHLSSVVCAACLNPDTRDAFQNTYHDGTHLAPPLDDDGGGSISGSKTATHGQEKSRFIVISGRRNRDSDGADVKDMVSAYFNFTGSAVYLYCIQPLGIPLVGVAPASMNLSFTLDNNLVGNFSHRGSESASGYASHVNVFAQSNLTEALHVLRVDVGVDSVFLFDYMIYTRDSGNDTTSNITSQNVNEHTKKHNIATFGGAIGGSVGVLAVISLCLALSIIKRRRNYNLRERRARGRSSLHTNASDDSPPMIGPAPFVPRFFPGTQIPSIYSDPPSYIESISNPSPLSAYSLGSSSLPPLAAPFPAHVRDTANVPPTLPPPMDVVPFPPLEDTTLTPPPSFDVAVASVLPARSLPSAAIGAQQSPDVNVTSSDPVLSPSSPSSSSRPPS